MKFILQIELGNEGMQTGRDIVLSLADSLKGEATLPLEVGVAGVLWDLNGNTVGKWSVAEDMPDVHTARQRLDDLRRKHSSFGAQDTEGRYAVLDVEDAVLEGKPFPFAGQKPWPHNNPFQLYETEPGWQAASAELVEAAHVYYNALVAKKLNITISQKGQV